MIDPRSMDLNSAFASLRTGDDPKSSMYRGPSPLQPQRSGAHHQDIETSLFDEIRGQIETIYAARCAGATGRTGVVGECGDHGVDG
jgi:hypothetical protein